MIPDRAEVRRYRHSDFEQIATAIGIAVKPIADLEAQFEAAALWFRLDRKRPRRIAPSKRREKLNQVAKSARRLLKSLGIDDPDEAVDGNGRAIMRGDAPLAWGGNVALCTRDGKFELADHKDCAGRGLNSAGFAVFEVGNQPATSVHFKEP